MSFSEELKNFSERISSLKDNILTEEATKMSMVIPLFQMLGYDVFNPKEFCPEYAADVGIKKGEKVDYAILFDNIPSILIECKSCTESLDKHGSQLFRYFSTTPAKFGILTNGIIYKFYTDLEEANKMDLIPFLELNLLSLQNHQISELQKFAKENFDSSTIFSTAEELKYSSLIKSVIQNEIDNPSPDFVKVLVSGVYDGKKNQAVMDKFTPIVKKAFSSLINEKINQKLSSALDKNLEDETTTAEKIPLPDSKIITTEEEIEAFYIIRGILAGTCSIEDIAYRDTESYFGILFKDNNRKPICRLNLDTKMKQLMIPDENKKFERHYIHSLNDIYQYKDALVNVVNRYI
ncbi:MAG: type I restriction endonuclease [Bacteroidales bacterium]|nr:type I restriction endonuclease [Clostridium sp.]MCM1204713.1 type I restriction endonuclease [Bacteroidales bacterium]